MISKILLTLAVIVIVALVFRHKARPAPPPQPRDAATDGSVRPQTLAYGLVVALIAVSGVIFWFVWRDQHRVLNIRVIDGASGTAVLYQAYKKSVDGRDFVTLDGRQVTLGDNDRVEIIAQ